MNVDLLLLVCPIESLVEFFQKVGLFILTVSFSYTSFSQHFLENPHTLMILHLYIFYSLWNDLMIKKSKSDMIVFMF